MSGLLGPILLMLGGWLVLGLIVVLGLTAWFRHQRNLDEHETPWETSALDHDYEVRWKDGVIESRRVRP